MTSEVMLKIYGRYQEENPQKPLQMAPQTNQNQCRYNRKQPSTNEKQVHVTRNLHFNKTSGAEKIQEQTCLKVKECVHKIYKSKGYPLNIYKSEGHIHKASENFSTAASSQEVTLDWFPGT